MALNNLKYLLAVFVVVSCVKPKETTPIPKNVTYTAFSFFTSQNPNLPQDIYAEIKGDSIIASTFIGVNLNTLIPTFEFDGNQVYVENKLQNSEKSSQNFTQTITYEVKQKDGKSKNYFVKFNTTNLPALYIDTNGMQILSKETYVKGKLVILGNNTTVKSYEGNMQIRGRGNSTWGLPKKPYKIKLDKKAGFFGTNEAKDYVLLANYSDKTLLRNEVGFEISRNLNLNYTPISEPVELILNGKYVGNYELVEQVEVGKNKINLFENEKEIENLTDAFFIEVDGFYTNEKVYFITKMNMPISVHYPDDEVITIKQKENIANHVQKFERRLFSDSTAIDDTGYQKYFDIDSYINFYLTNEIIGNPDLFWSSYMYKKQGNDKIFSGPIWDMDIAFSNDFRLGDTQNKLMQSVGFEPKNWINKLMQDKIFRNKIKLRWNIIKTGKIAQIETYIDKMAQKIGYSQQKNFQTWPILNQKVYNNYQALGSFEAEVAFLKNYYTKRINWLDTQFNSTKFD